MPAPSEWFEKINDSRWPDTPRMDAYYFPSVRINDRTHVEWPWDDRPIPPRERIDSELLETVVQTRKRFLFDGMTVKKHHVYIKGFENTREGELSRRVAFRGNGHAVYESYTRYLDGLPEAVRDAREHHGRAYTRYLDGLPGNSRAGDGYDGDKIGEIRVEMNRSGGAAKLNATFGVEATDAYEPLKNFRVYRMDEFLLSLRGSTFDLLPVNKRNDDAVVDYARDVIGKHIVEAPRRNTAEYGIEMAGTD